LAFKCNMPSSYSICRTHSVVWDGIRENDGPPSSGFCVK
jgi:hypothetical protein